MTPARFAQNPYASLGGNRPATLSPDRMINDPWFLLRDDTKYQHTVIAGPRRAYRVVPLQLAEETRRVIHLYADGHPLHVTGELSDLAATTLAAACTNAPDPNAIPLWLEAWTAADTPGAPVGAFIGLDLGPANVEPFALDTPEGPRLITVVGRAVRLREARRWPADLEAETTDMLARLLAGAATTPTEQLLGEIARASRT